MTRLYLLFAIVGILLVGCSKEEPAPLPPLKAVELPSGVSGEYSGRLPCDACKANLVRVRLMDDSSAVVVRTIVADDKKVDTLTGSYSVSSEKVTLIFSEKSEKWQFKLINSGNMALLTGTGDVYVDADSMKAELIRIISSSKAKEGSL